MLPAELMGLNVNNFKQLNNLIKNKSFFNALISNVSSTLYFIKNKKFNSVILNYDEKSENLFKWYQQLIAESLGKQNKGLLPIISSLPKDNHSVMQLYLDGFKNNFFTFFYVNEHKSEKLNNSQILPNLGYELEIPMLEARFVTTEQGTGIVHCAPSHGPDDFNLCLKHGIKAIETVDGDGKYTKNVHLFEGNHIFKANPIVIEKLKEQKKLLANGELVHSYPHSWRSKAPLVHRATPQWFISMESHKLRDKALKALDETTFYPSKGKERLKAMIETRPDWCVSRQRVWGVPLPIFINKKTKEILVDDEVNLNVANIYEKEGSDCWFSDNPQRFLGEKYKSEDYDKLSDIVEVWFDSGSTHSFVLEKREDLKWPASMYLEGSDQHRGWFHSSLLESCGTRGRAPFESILSHGFVVDGKGLKMSKSLGNVIAPEDILKKYGADILRIWVASSNYAEDLRIDHSILDQHADSYRKIRNTFRYLLGNLNDNYNWQ